MRHDGVGRNADGDNHQIHFYIVNRAFNGHWTAATAFVGFAEFHTLDAHGGDVSAFVAEVFNGVVERHKFDAFLFGVPHFLAAGGHFFFAAAINNHHLFGAHTTGGASGVHCGVATTDDSHTATCWSRCVEAFSACTHKVDAGEIFIRRNNADKVFARDVHKAGKACA